MLKLDDTSLILINPSPSNVKIKVVILFLKLVVLKFAINHLSALLEAIIEAAIIFSGLGESSNT